MNVTDNGDEKRVFLLLPIRRRRIWVRPPKRILPVTPTRVAFDLERLGVVTKTSGIFSPNKEEITFHQGDSSSDNAEAIRPGGLFDDDEDESETGGDLNDDDPGDQDEGVQDK